MTALYEEHGFMEKFLWKEMFEFLQKKKIMLISNKECASLMCAYICKEKENAGIFLIYTDLHFM